MVESVLLHVWNLTCCPALLPCREAKDKAGPKAKEAADAVKGQSKDVAGAAKGNINSGADKAKDTLSAGQCNKSSLPEMVYMSETYYMDAPVILVLHLHVLLSGLCGIFLQGRSDVIKATASYRICL